MPARSSGYSRAMSEMGPEHHLEPIPPSREAFEWLASYGDPEIEESIREMARRVRTIVPECLAMSVTINDDGLTFTLMADARGASMLDAMQYLDGGPCETAVVEGQPRLTSEPSEAEGSWQLFARAGAAVGVASTLSLPLLGDDEVVGGVNIYASTPGAFDGRHEEVARAVSGWAGGAVRDADLTFASRVRATTAPARLRERGTTDVATGYVAAHQDVDMAVAAQRISEAAARAGVSPADLARFILDAQPHRP